MRMSRIKWLECSNGAQRSLLHQRPIELAHQRTPYFANQMPMIILQVSVIAGSSQHQVHTIDLSHVRDGTNHKGGRWGIVGPCQVRGLLIQSAIALQVVCQHMPLASISCASID